MSLETHYLTLCRLLLIKINCNWCETTLNLLSISVHYNYVGMLHPVLSDWRIKSGYITFLLSLDRQADDNS